MEHEVSTMPGASIPVYNPLSECELASCAKVRETRDLLGMREFEFALIIGVNRGFVLLWESNALVPMPDAANLIHIIHSCVTCWPDRILKARIALARHGPIPARAVLLHDMKVD